jgi:excinuclease UvrABC ATPase subunit
MQTIRIRGARTHNLRSIDLDLPRDRLIVLTGLSGSGKSSLAFDTIYAEGQRRYVESLSAYARQFLSMMEKPDVDTIEGLSPAISIEQKSTSHNPRSTVATVTEIYDYLRLLYARAGIPRCPDHGLELTARTVSQMVDQVLELPEGTPLLLLAPVIKERKGEHEKVLEELKGKGFVRARIDGNVVELDELVAPTQGVATLIEPWSTASRCGRTSRSASPSRSRRRCASAAASPRSPSSTSRSAPGWCSRTSSPATSAAGRSRSSSRGCSSSTTRAAPPRLATASA